MSVIPLILEGANANVVETMEQFEKAGGLDGKVILIQGLDAAQLRDQSDANVSYNLRVGSEYRDHRDVGRSDLSQDSAIKLLPGGAVIIETEELVHLPKSLFGHIVPKVSLLQQGISNTASKVDPGYYGKLLVTVFNLGKRTVELRRGDAICSIYFLEVLAGARPYAKPAKRILGVAEAHTWRKARDILEANSALITVIQIILTALLIGVTALAILLRKVE